MSDRIYTEREVADLIARAAERQQDARHREASVGLTLEEIERIGAETGIDPAHLRAAAAEMDAVGRTLKRQSDQTKTHVLVERWVDAPLTPEAWEDAVAELQARHGVDASFWMGNSAGGTVQQVGNAYEWRHTSGLGIQTTVTASLRDGRTRLQLRQLVGMASPTTEGVVYGLIIAMLIGAIAGVLSQSAWVGPVALLAAWLAAAPLVTTLDRRWRARKLVDLEALADDLTPLLATAPAAVDTAAQEAAPTAPSGLLDLDRLGEAPEAEQGGANARRVRD